MQPPDEELIRQIRAHDAAAFEIFYLRYRPAIQRHVLSMVREAAAGEDLVQEVFLRVWTRAEQWDGHGAAKAWLYRIATNLALNHLRTLRRRPQQPLEPPRAEDLEEESMAPGWMVDAASVEPPAALEMAERLRHFRQLVAELPEDKREVLHLVYEAEMDLRSVADRLGIPEGTVKSRLYYGKRQLARIWQEDAW
jgi:RNA polymerase sigma-70 factor (ECF subfamily)